MLFDRLYGDSSPAVEYNLRQQAVRLKKAG